jgi:hypothetical protein
MKCVYCSNCGLRLTVIRKALPKYGRIIDLIEPHECLDEPVEFDLTPIEVPAFTSVPEKGKNKFVQKLNGLQPRTEGTGDRRNPEHIKSDASSIAPRTLLDSVKSMHNTTPVNDMRNEPSTGE